MNEFGEGGVDTVIVFPGNGSAWEKHRFARLARDWGLDCLGLDMAPGFVRSPFAGQVEAARQALASSPDPAATLMVGSSYGAYVLLHALAEAPPYPGRAVIFSPVLGMAMVKGPGGFQISMPPRHKKLLQLAQAGRFPVPVHGLDIHTGTEDQGCDPGLARRFAAGAGAGLTVIPGAGHGLGREYELAVVSRMLS